MIPFSGELMTCALCGRQEKSDPGIESGWRAIQMDGRVYYVCPNELPKDGSTATEYEIAYSRIFRVLFAREEAKKKRS